jgi:hypothetical protein
MHPTLPSAERMVVPLVVVAAAEVVTGPFEVL